MKRFSALVFFFQIILTVIPASEQENVTDTIHGTTYSAAGSQNEADAWVIPVRGDIDPAMTAFVRRETRRAMNNKAGFIIYELDTFGGRVDCALQIASFISSIKTARTVAWVQNSDKSMGVSWSAGALIAFSCTSIYMANGTSMGAAAPVQAGADGHAEPAGEKTVAAVRSQMAALAELNNHPISIALAMVDFDVDLWEVSIDGVISAMALNELETLEKSGANITRLKEISPKGKLLALTSGEAFRYGLSGGGADNLTELLSKIGAQTAIESSSSIADNLISFLVSGPVQVILIILGVILIFIEMNTAGFGIAGTLSVICFTLVFGTGALLGRLSSLEIVLFLLGLGLLALEIFVIPGFGITGISGIISIGMSLVLSMQDFVIPQFEWEWTLLGRNITVVSAGIITAVVCIILIALLSPKLRIFDFLTLKTQLTGTVYDTASNKAGADYEDLYGKIGFAATILRPSGKVKIENRVYQAETEGDFIESGTAVKVSLVRGNYIVVKRVE